MTGLPKRLVEAAVPIALAAGVASALPAAAQDAAKPNILLIVGDDVGYGDLGPYLGVDPIRRGHLAWGRQGEQLAAGARRHVLTVHPGLLGQRGHPRRHLAAAQDRACSVRSGAEAGRPVVRRRAGPGSMKPGFHDRIGERAK